MYHDMDDRRLQQLTPERLDRLCEQRPFFLEHENYYGENILMSSIRLGNVDLVKRIIEKTDMVYLNKDVYIGWDNCQRALDVAIDSSTEKTKNAKAYECMKLLLEAGADPNLIKWRNGGSALYRALFRVAPHEIIMLLLENKARIIRHVKEDQDRLKQVKARVVEDQWERCRLMFIADTKSYFSNVPADLVRKICILSLPNF